MKAMMCKSYGSPDVLELREVEKPTPRDHEVLIKTLATTVTAGDCRVRSLHMPAGFGLIARVVLGYSRPRQPILGAELTGIIESVGKNVSKFRAGDEVIAYTGASLGCHAQYKCMPEDGALVLKPANLTFDEAAAMSSGGTTALDFFRRAKLQSGERVIVIGASGSVGSAAVQLARHFGAVVTGVCSTANVAWVKALGASEVIDYTQADFTQNGETYDVIVDTAGTAPYARSQASLAQRGRLLLVLSGLLDLLHAPWVSITSSKKVIAGPASGRVEDLRFLANLAAAGEYKPVIDRCYPFEQLAEAHRYVDAGHKKGNVVITVAHDE
jgi:NADPH:quinone reductase-like Zn-dependent oxidoreductase